MFDEQLIVAGTGIRTIGQMTMETLAWLRKADKVLHVVNDPVAEELIRSLNPTSESMTHLYKDGQDRMITYEQMVEMVLSHVRQGKMVVFASYGHPGVFAYSTHESVRRARLEGYKARMLPGISAEDCLIADLGIDPASAGCQSFEASDFLVNDRMIDGRSHLLLWQIGVLGNAVYKNGGRYQLKGVPELLMKLYRHGYPPQHLAYVYEAPVFPGVQPMIRPVPLMALASSGVTATSTLYIPPARPSYMSYTVPFTPVPTAPRG